MYRPTGLEIRFIAGLLDEIETVGHAEVIIMYPASLVSATAELDKEAMSVLDVIHVAGKRIRGIL